MSWSALVVKLNSLQIAYLPTKVKSIGLVRGHHRKLLLIKGTENLSPSITRHFGHCCQMCVGFSVGLPVFVLLHFRHALARSVVDANSYFFGAKEFYVTFTNTSAITRI
jgi:hypothetical protein